MYREKISVGTAMELLVLSGEKYGKQDPKAFLEEISEKQMDQKEVREFVKSFKTKQEEPEKEDILEDETESETEDALENEAEPEREESKDIWMSFIEIEEKSYSDMTPETLQEFTRELVYILEKYNIRNRLTR